MTPTSDRLQALLDRAREANEIERDRVSLDTFLASLHKEDREFNEVQLKQTQLAIYETLLRLFDATTPVSQTNPTSAMTVSCAVQTDAATISLCDLLPKARKEAYYRGFDAGRDYGDAQGIQEGRSAGITEGLALGFEQGLAEGLKLGLEQGKEIGMQQGIEIGREVGYADGLAKGIRQAKEGTNKAGDEGRRGHTLRMETTRENVVVKLPPALASTTPKKRDLEKAKTRSHGADPFASLLDLVHKK